MRNSFVRAFAVAAFFTLAFAVVDRPTTLLAGTLPDISGTWYAQGNTLMRCYISQSGRSVTFKNEQGYTANGQFVFNNPSAVDVDWGYRGGRIRATISPDLQRIDWSNGTYWTRGSGYNPTPPPTPTPTPPPPRLNVTTRVEGNASSPIYVYRASLANGYSAKYAQCVSFRNVSNKEATDVDFSFVVTRYSGTVEADFGMVDRGKFTPPIAIDDHCWTAPNWPNHSVKLMSQETVRVKEVTFADGTTWRPGKPFVRAYGNGGAPLPNPIEEPGSPSEPR